MDMTLSPTLGTKVDVEDPQVFSMWELDQGTPDVIDKINKSGEPALITNHGRFVALICPLAGRVEPLIMRRIASEFAAEVAEQPV
jgi:antitoxin (DNA-binding transcriptional repressor) of toxin-antitoxin stability system